MTASDGAEVPLFPLHTVLFPGGRLPLQIFEARYLDMISGCLKQDSGFVVVLISGGNEVVRDRNDQPPRLFEVGTYADIRDWDAPTGGPLRIVACGDRRVRITAVRQVENHLLIGRVEALPVPVDPLDGRHPELIEILDTLMLHPLIQRLGLETGELDCERLSCLLGQYLPIDERHKQSLLEMPDSVARLDRIAGLVNEIQE